jgi:glucose dehydrogenase
MTFHLGRGMVVRGARHQNDAKGKVMARSLMRHVTLASICLLAQIAAAEPDGGDLNGAFSREQANRGASVFGAQCTSCHTPAQAANLMLARGAGSRLQEYHQRLSQLMPPQSAIRPSPQQFLDLIAYLSRTAGAGYGTSDIGIDQRSWRDLKVALAATGAAKQQAPTLAWPAWRSDPQATAYSPASQIDRTNVSKLEIAWRWSASNFGPSPELRNITTPLMVDGVLFATAGLTRSVVAIDAASGETLWMWRPAETEARFTNAPRKGAGRGVAYWSRGKDARIYTVTPGFHLVALDAKTGRPITTFGENGTIDLMQGLRGGPAEGLPDIGSQSPPLVVGDVLVVGPAHLASMQPKSRANVKGDIRAFDARTGKLLWTFRSIPQSGDKGYETWTKGAAERTGNGGVWAPMSADPKTGAIFLPVESGTSDLYGGERKGSNLFTSSLVSLDAKTGKLRWSQQLIHHDIWDWDVPATPILADIPAATGARRAVLQITKQGFVYAFDRDTGAPLWPMPEVSVPTSDVPGEETWPTQPMPALPAPFDRQGVTPSDLIDFTPQLHAEALQATKPYRLGAFMAPPSLSSAADGTRGTLSLPSVIGGGNWEGGAYDPTSGLLYVGSMTQAWILALAANAAGADMPYAARPRPAPDVRGLPIVKPPYGRITAIDMKTGQHAWMMANADTPRSIADHPDLKGLVIPRTGVVTRAGLLVTSTLLFAGEGIGGSAVLRAHDKATGEILATIPLPATQTGLPMTYVWGGRQYIVMAVGDGVTPSQIVALALPD